jgi:hypothetical protein
MCDTSFHLKKCGDTVFISTMECWCDHPTIFAGKLTGCYGKSPFLMGKSPFLMGKSPFLMGKSPFVMGKSPFVMGKSPSLMGKSPFLMGKSTINGTFSIYHVKLPKAKSRVWSTPRAVFKTQRYLRDLDQKGLRMTEVRGASSGNMGKYRCKDH